MESIFAFLMAFSFLFAIGGLLLLVWSISTSQFAMGPASAKVIFVDKVHPEKEDPSTEHGLSSWRLQRLDRSAGACSRYLIFSSLFWLLLGSIFGLIASYKFQFPDWLASSPYLTFGRIRPLHLNTVAYGWLSQSGMGIALWLMPRLLHRPLIGARFAIVGTHGWNLALVIGTAALFCGWTDGVEWLEYPWPVDLLLAGSGAAIGLPVLFTILRRRVEHLYVSVWYIGAAFIWFPILFVVANAPIYSGVQHAIVNWWYAHNVLGLWLTPFGLGAAYYLIPKVLGRPIYSYQLSLLGFWSLALFYSQVGVHHLIGGPVPTWLVSLSVVTSVMMVVPVLAVAINHHMTVGRNFKALRTSPTLSFIVPGSMMYTIVSVQGSLMALRTANQTTHFTHYTVAHAHLGVYGFFSFVMFGACYFALPRLIGYDWPKPALTRWHFWLTFFGILVYVIGLSIGGILQGLQMLDPSISFSTTVANTKPYLWIRSIGGTMMTLGHFVFAYHVWLLHRLRSSV